MAVFPSRLAYPAKYSADPIDVFVAGDASLRYGKFVEGHYTISTANHMTVYYEEEVYDDQAGDYVYEGQPNYAIIELDASGYSKLTISAYTGHSRDSEGKVGWGVAKANSASDTYSTIGVTTVTDFEFDISGQSTVYVKIYSRYYKVSVRGIRLE